MVAFYREVLGLPLRLPYEPGEGWAGFRAGDVVIYLIEEESSAAHPPPRMTGARQPARHRLVRLRGRRPRRGDRRARRPGVSWAGDVVASEWYRYRGVHDPEGNLVYLTEPLLDRADSPAPDVRREP